MCSYQAVSLQNAINQFSKIERTLIVVLIGNEQELVKQLLFILISI